MLTQYQALRSSGGLVDLAGWSSVTFRGADRQAFLHNFCTNDIKRLAPGSSCEAFVTNVKGKIVGHGLVICRTDELVFFGAPNQGHRLAEHLDRYIIREDVQLGDTTGERSFVLIAGGGGVRGRLAGESLDGIPCKLVGSDFECLLEVVPENRPAVIEQLVARGFQLCDQPAFTAARIEAGVPLFGVDFDDQNLPQEVGRDREAISFTKGCYLGQETVARIDALGHVNQKLVGIRFTGSEVPAAETELSRDGSTVGRVTSAAWSPRLNAPLALAMVRREANATGDQLESRLGAAHVVALPIRAIA